jgi:hypothetical protein
MLAVLEEEPVTTVLNVRRSEGDASGPEAIRRAVWYREDIARLLRFQRLCELYPVEEAWRRTIGKNGCAGMPGGD